MGSLIEKLDEYQILNNLLPGAFFCLMLRFMFDIAFPTNNAFEDIIVYFFVGLIIGRIGSLCVGKFLEKIRFIKFAPHHEYVQASKIDLKIDTLSAVNNYFRSLLTSSVILFIIWIFMLIKLNQVWTWISANWQGFVVVFLIGLFLFSYRKQTKFVRDRVEKASTLKKD